MTEIKGKLSDSMFYHYLILGEHDKILQYDIQVDVEDLIKRCTNIVIGMKPSLTYKFVIDKFFETDMVNNGPRDRFSSRMLQFALNGRNEELIRCILKEYKDSNIYLDKLDIVLMYITAKQSYDHIFISELLNEFIILSPHNKNFVVVYIKNMIHNDCVDICEKIFENIEYRIYFSYAIIAIAKSIECKLDTYSRELHDCSAHVTNLLNFYAKLAEEYKLKAITMESINTDGMSELDRLCHNFLEIIDIVRGN